ncbi:MAG TPA: hypothetical protein VNZ03_29345 [Terriglobales bacterium]|jgi:hypothetical protein|nr:hypothetical protein [Terriglobales bacterium]
MKQVLDAILKLLLQNGTLLGELSADVYALKTVVAAFGPEAQKALDQQVAAERSKIQQPIQELRMLLEALRAGVSGIPN